MKSGRRIAHSGKSRLMTENNYMMEDAQMSDDALERMRGEEMNFPKGTEFFNDEGAPMARLPDGRVINAFGGWGNEYDEPMSYATPISRSEFNSLVNRSLTEGAPEVAAALAKAYPCPISLRSNPQRMV